MKKMIIVLVILVNFFSCKKISEWNRPAQKGAKPDAIQNYSVKNLYGKSVIYFETSDPNTLYIQAVYSTDFHVQREVKASKYADSLILEGFPKTGEYTVNLYTVGVDEQRSDPVSVKVFPDTPSFVTALTTADVHSAFGGLLVEAENVHEDDLVLETIVKDEKGTWRSLNRYYTRGKKILYSIRGLAPTLQNFGLCVQDRWGHFSDTIYKALTPLSEMQISMANYQKIILPTDAPEFPGVAVATDKLFDGILTNYYTSARGTGTPQHFTINLRGAFYVSRLHLYQRPGTAYVFAGIAPKRFRIWGSLEPNPSGALDESWTLFGEYEVYKPSGLPLGQTSAEDVQAAAAGADYEVLGTPKLVRYLRFQTLETFGGSDYITINEIEVFGNKPE